MSASREPVVLRYLSEAFGELTLEEDRNASKERHPANKPALAPIPQLRLLPQEDAE